MQIKRIIPNSLTCANLLCGSVAVFLATQGVFMWAFACIIAGAVFDFFDGSSARLLKCPSPIGVELDSLADVITFGLAPSMMLMCYLRPIIGWWALIVLLMTAFSALRLAKFNVDDRQTTSFIGLATPPNAIFWASLCCMPYGFTATPWLPWVLLGLCLVSCYLLISEIPFFGMKFKNLSWRDNWQVYVFLIGCIIIIAFSIIRAYMLQHIELAVFAGAACILWYILYNFITLIRKK